MSPESPRTVDPAIEAYIAEDTMLVIASIKASLDARDAERVMRAAEQESASTGSAHA